MTVFIDAISTSVKVISGLMIIFCLALCWLFSPPIYPRNIPTIPFWVTLLPFFYDVDQEETFKRYIRKPLLKHGAVKFFFGGQWNVLVQRSTYLAEVFKNEEVYQKSGNDKKLPHSVIAEYLGDNIISSRGSDYRTYRTVIKPGLQENFDPEPIIQNAQKLYSLLRQRSADGKSAEPNIQDVLQRYSITNILACLLNSDLSLLDDDNVDLNKLQRQVKKEIFKPIFLSFPFLDRLGWLFPSRQRSRQTIHTFAQELQRVVCAGREKNPYWMASEKLGSRLVAARESGVLTHRQFRDNLNVVFVAGQENPQLAMLSALYLLGKYPDVQAKLRYEVDMCPDGDLSPVVLGKLPFLSSVIYESLRLFPPISQLVNRRVDRPASLGDNIYIPRDTYVGYNSYATNRDPGVWGPTADEFMPERWGTNNEDILKRFRRAKARAEFISFHGGSRACLGERFALLEMRITLFVLVKNCTWTLDPDWPDRMTPVNSPETLLLTDISELTQDLIHLQAGPLYPRELRLVFDHRQG